MVVDTTAAQFVAEASVEFFRAWCGLVNGMDKIDRDGTRAALDGLVAALTRARGDLEPASEAATVIDAKLSMLADVRSNIAP